MFTTLCTYWLAAGEKQDQKLEEDIDELNEYYGHK